jgi:adenylate kinase
MIPSIAQSDRAAWLKGPAFECSVKPAAQSRPWRLVLLGPPGVGKGTQAELLAAHLGACHLSTGDVFRMAKRMDSCQATAAMREALEFMRAGKLVSDGLVMAMVAERSKCLHCGGGFILDGFPRTLQQAIDFDTLLVAQNIMIDAVIDYELSLEATIARAAGRLTCPACHAVYHTISKPPAVIGMCDQCGAKLKQREDDRPEVAQVRMRQYAAVTEPLTEYYRGRGVLVAISAEASPSEIFINTLKALEARK